MVRGIADKISAPQGRDIERARKYWKLIIDIRPEIRDIYGNIELVDQKISVDHFVPSIWMIHAADDMIVKESYKTDGNTVHLGSRDIYDELKDIHPDLHYTEYKAGELKERFGINLHCSWVPAGQDEEVKEWLFSRFK